MKLLLTPPADPLPIPHKTDADPLPDPLQERHRREVAEQDFEKANKAAAAEQARRGREQSRLKEQQEAQQRLAAHRHATCEPTAMLGISDCSCRTSFLKLSFVIFFRQIMPSLPCLTRMIGRIGWVKTHNRFCLPHLLCQASTTSLP